MVLVKDNFISSELILSLRSDILFDRKHTFGMSSVGQDPFYSVDLNPEEPVIKLLLNKINSLVSGAYNIKRVYANIQYSGMNGSWHTDDGQLTALLFINEELQDGNFEIKLSSNDISTIEPLPGRLLVFDSALLHRGLSSSTLRIPRISLAFKLWR